MLVSLTGINQNFYNVVLSVVISGFGKADHTSTKQCCHVHVFMTKYVYIYALIWMLLLY